VRPTHHLGLPNGAWDAPYLIPDTTPIGREFLNNYNILMIIV